MAFSPVDERHTDDFEQLLLAGGTVDALQDRLKAALQWAEGQVISPTTVERLRASARQVLARFLLEAPAFTSHGGQTPDPSCAQDVTVEVSREGAVNIQLPAEVRRWLLQTQSPISF